MNQWVRHTVVDVLVGCAETVPKWFRRGSMKTLVELFVYDDDEAVASIQVLEFAAPNDVSTRVSEVYGRFVMRRVTPGHPPVTRLYTEPADAVSGALRAAGWGELALSAGEYGDGS